jgi:hypothetical protein
MSDRDDFYDEMGRFWKVSDIERVLSGDPAEDVAGEDTVSALVEAREHLIGPPDQTTRSSHLLAMAAAIEDFATEPSESAPTPTMSRRTFGRRIMRRTWLIGSRAALAGGLLAVSSLGLAYAGVDLPGSAAEQAWQAVGLHIPNQGDLGADSASDDVRAVIDGSEERGCEFGQAVSEAASADSQKQGPSEDPCAGQEGTESKGSKATGDENSAEGRAKAAEKSDGHSESGSDNAGTNDDAGRETASEKSGGKSDTGGGNAGPGGSDDAVSSDDFGKDTASNGSGNADTGEEAASEKSGGAPKPDTPSGP